MSNHQSYVFQQPAVGRLLQQHFALLFLPSCIMDEKGAPLFFSTLAERRLEEHASSERSVSALFGEKAEEEFLIPASRNDLPTLKRIYGSASVMVKGACVTVMDLREEGHRRILLYGREHDAGSGQTLCFAAWASPERYDYSACPALPLYPFLRFLDCHPRASLAILDSRRYYYLSPDLAWSYVQSEVAPERLLGAPMYQFLPPDEARRHADTLARLKADQPDGPTLCWRQVRSGGKEARIQTWPNVMNIHGERVNLSLVREISPEENLGEDGGRHAATTGLSQETRERLKDFQGVSPVMAYTVRQMEKAAASSMPVCINGETGTGKSLAARLIHEMSMERAGPFVSINCGAVPEALFESTFFGHARGAFTGAVASRKGIMAQAAGGTLFLDEVGELSLNCQVKLLQALSERRFWPVGSDRAQRCEFRLITATNRNMRQMVHDGHFREDLFYRIHVFELSIPPLRSRREDIPWLTDSIKKNMGLSLTFSRRDSARLKQHTWPGNVRELENVTLRYAAEGSLDFFHPAEGEEKGAPAGLKQRLLAAERNIIVDTLGKHRWNRNAAARELGISRVTLFRKMRDLKI